VRSIGEGGGGTFFCNCAACCSASLLGAREPFTLIQLLTRSRLITVKKSQLKLAFTSHREFRVHVSTLQQPPHVTKDSTTIRTIKGFQGITDSFVVTRKVAL
jgi:hypothetical protein